MKSILSMIAVVATAVCVTISATAQDTAHHNTSKRTPEERAKWQTEKMVKALNLTSEQTKKVDSINLKFAKEREAGLANMAGDKEERIKAMKKIRDEKNMAFQTVLNDDQYNAYLKLQEEKMQKMKEKKSGGDGN